MVQMYMYVDWDLYLLGSCLEVLIRRKGLFPGAGFTKSAQC